MELVAIDLNFTTPVILSIVFLSMLFYRPAPIWFLPAWRVHVRNTAAIFLVTGKAGIYIHCFAAGQWLLLTRLVVRMANAVKKM